MPTVLTAQQVVDGINEVGFESYEEFVFALGGLKKWYKVRLFQAASTAKEKERQATSAALASQSAQYSSLADGLESEIEQDALTYIAQNPPA